MIHEKPGAPKTKWEDIFRKTMARDDWLMEAMGDKVKWKSGEEMFVEKATALCNPRKRKAGAKQEVHNMSLVHEKLKMKQTATGKNTNNNKKNKSNDNLSKKNKN